LHRPQADERPTFTPSVAFALADRDCPPGSDRQV